MMRNNDNEEDPKKKKKRYSIPVKLLSYEAHLSYRPLCLLYPPDFKSSSAFSPCSSGNSLSLVICCPPNLQLYSLSYSSHQPAWLPPTTFMGNHAFGQLQVRLVSCISRSPHPLSPTNVMKMSPQSSPGPLTFKRVNIQKYFLKLFRQLKTFFLISYN